jgi:hypothetical protein
MALKCSDKKGLVIQGNGQSYSFKDGDAIPDRIFVNDFPGDNGVNFCAALIKAGRIKDVSEKKEKESVREEKKK